MWKFALILIFFSITVNGSFLNLFSKSTVNADIPSQKCSDPVNSKNNLNYSATTHLTQFSNKCVLTGLSLSTQANETEIDIHNLCYQYNLVCSGNEEIIASCASNTLLTISDQTKTEIFIGNCINISNQCAITNVKITGNAFTQNASIPFNFSIIIFAGDVAKNSTFLIENDIPSETLVSCPSNIDIVTLPTTRGKNEQNVRKDQRPHRRLVLDQ
jgi:hypothetical protein